MKVINFIKYSSQSFSEKSFISLSVQLIFASLQTNETLIVEEPYNRSYGRMSSTSQEIPPPPILDFIL